MAEVPEVETPVRDLREARIGRTIREAQRDLFGRKGQLDASGK